MRKKLAVLVTAVTVVGLGVTALIAPASSGTHDRRRGQPLRSHGAVGTWAVVVDPAGPEGEPFEAMITFHGDGTVVEIEPRAAGTALGTWRPLGRRRFAFSFRTFNLQDGQIVPAVVTAVDNTLHDGAQRYSGPFRVQAFDPQGNVVFTGEGTAEGRRFGLQRLR